MNQLEVKAYYPVTMDINIVIYDVIYGIDDKIKFSCNVCGKVKKIRYSKVQDDKDGRSYFKTYNHKIYVDECLRADY